DALTTTPLGDPIRMPYGVPAQKVTPGGVSYASGDDILITDVLSFEVKAAWFNNPTFESILKNSSPPVRPLFVVQNNVPVTVNTEEPFDDLPLCTLNTNAAYLGKRVFDTWYQNATPLAGGDDIDWDRSLIANGATGIRPGFLNQRTDQVPV